MTLILVDNRTRSIVYTSQNDAFIALATLDLDTADDTQTTQDADKSDLTTRKKGKLNNCE